MFLILGVNVKRLKGSEKTKSRKDMCPYLYSFYHELLVCLLYLHVSNNAPHPVIKCGKRSFRPFSHRDNDLLIRYGRNISGCIDTCHVSSTVRINHNLTRTIGFHHFAECAAIGRKPDLHKYSVEFHQTFFLRFTVLDT